MTLPAIAAAVLLQAVQGIADLDWLAGSWLACEDGREVSETWSDARGGLMAGTTLTLGRSGRGGVEFARIVTTGDGTLAYLAQPNGAPPTEFALLDAGPDRVTFENPDHDFPQRVIYHREGDVLRARIEGIADGRAAAMDWTYRSAAFNARCPG